MLPLQGVGTHVFAPRAMVLMAKFVWPTVIPLLFKLATHLRVERNLKERPALLLVRLVTLALGRRSPVSARRGLPRLGAPFGTAAFLLLPPATLLAARPRPLMARRVQ